MKKLLLIFIIIILFTSCSKKESELDTFLGGVHKIRELHTFTKNSFEFKGSFFVVLGEISGGQVEEVQVSFWWQLNDGSYTFSTLPLEKCRVKINNERKNPIVTFGWKDRRFYNWETSYIMEHIVIYMLIECREEHWPLGLTF